MGDMETWRHRHGDIDMEISYGKRRFSLIRLTFAHRANGSSSFVCVLTKKQTEFISLQSE
jgi:hypothetical protein